MNLQEYFANTKGVGVLSTANKSGEVDSAIYAKPHFIDEETVAFIMHEKLTYANLQENPQACYLFLEEKPGYDGKRVYLTKTKEEKNSDLLFELRKKTYPLKEDVDLYLVYFKINRLEPLVIKADK